EDGIRDFHVTGVQTCLFRSVPIRRRGAPTLGSRPRATGSRGLRHTVIGVAVIAIMLFPLYWMVNVSLQPAGNAAATPWLPFDLRSEERRVGKEGRSRWSACE